MFLICPMGLIQFSLKWTLGRGWEKDQAITGGKGVVRLPKGCTKMDQNRPKWSPYHDPSMTKQKCFELVLNSQCNAILIQMDTLKG